MKKIAFILLMLALFFIAGCGKSDSNPAHVYSGKVFVDSMTLSGGPAAAAKSLMTAATTSLSDLASTITTTYDVGTVSISAGDFIEMQGSIVNDTPDTVQGLALVVMPRIISSGTMTDYASGDQITLAPGESFAFYGGADIGTDSFPFMPVPQVWTAYFFDDPSAPTIWHDGVAAVLEYVDTHTPRAIGRLLFTVTE